ncbi:hypothetical protein LOK49_LG04G00684 [Camellia lanceoleosa]|uniref:Uncharacterized protein n=1 Tax=Camellia lanceoleosa TaxID=1840588 RepID=A0ACC0HWM8_9ERIC|nr:hypothetical protein LOK49_LG04G00684 [Camellia lanceoleosa]
MEITEYYRGETHTILTHPFTRLPRSPRGRRFLTSLFGSLQLTLSLSHFLPPSSLHFIANLKHGDWPPPNLYHYLVACPFGWWKT